MEASLKVLKKDKQLAKIIAKYERPTMDWGGRGGKNVFQALVRSIVYQQLSGKAAATIYARFSMLFTNKDFSKLTGEEVKALAAKQKFPTPEQVLKMNFVKLRSVGLSGQKATYIQDLALKFTDGTIKHKTLHKMSTEEVTKHLTQVKGVGVWTVHMLQIFTLGRLDVLPVGDLGVQKGFQIVYKLKKLPNAREMELLAKDWREHASVASWYFWRVADAGKLTSKIKKLPKRER
jgi:DNA-3-methyladenine glycosylase II